MGILLRFVVCVYGVLVPRSYFQKLVRREYVAELFSLLLAAGGHQTGEARVLIKGGPDYTLRSIHGTRIEVMGEPCVLALGIDITEQKRLEALVQELESQAGSS